eukprot:scaffold21832_cov62-Phaeocystis_antarctica.AAC.13
MTGGDVPVMDTVGGRPEGRRGRGNWARLLPPRIHLAATEAFYEVNRSQFQSGPGCRDCHSCRPLRLFLPANGLTITREPNATPSPNARSLEFAQNVKSRKCRPSSSHTFTESCDRRVCLECRERRGALLGLDASRLRPRAALLHGASGVLLHRAQDGLQRGLRGVLRRLHLPARLDRRHVPCGGGLELVQGRVLRRRLVAGLGLALVELRRVELVGLGPYHVRLEGGLRQREYNLPDLHTTGGARAQDALLDRSQGRPALTRRLIAICGNGGRSGGGGGGGGGGACSLQASAVDRAWVRVRVRSQVRVRVWARARVRVSRPPVRCAASSAACGSMAPSASTGAASVGAEVGASGVVPSPSSPSSLYTPLMYCVSESSAACCATVRTLLSAARAASE